MYSFDLPMLVASTASSTEQVGRSRKGIGSLRQERMLMDIEDGALVHKDEDEKNLYLLNRYTKNLTRDNARLNAYTENL
jgi:hypothetical protein